MKLFSRFLLAGAGTFLLLGASLLPAQGIYKPVEGTVGVDIPGIGVVPREIIWEADGSEMVLIPGGTYTIGLDNPGERGASRAEGPAVKVTVSPFYIDRKEVEYETYMRIARDRGLGLPRGVDGQGVLRSGGPVVGVTWDDALTYAQLLRKDLPTEAEWEIAARGPSSTLYPWGNEPQPGAAALGRGGSGRPDMVGANPQDVSAFGVFDVAGNVSEWTKDYYERDYYTRVANLVDPVITEGRDARTIRGASYLATSDGRLTLRESLVQSHTRDRVGFRTVFRLRPREQVEAARATPTPTATPRLEEVLGVVSDELLAIFREPGKQLPTKFAPTAFGIQNVGVPFVNPTAHHLLFGFYEQRTGALHGYPMRLNSGETRPLMVPRELSLAVLVYPVGMEMDHVVSLGVINSTSNPLVVVPHHAFNPTIRVEDGTRRELQSHVEARQVYGRSMRPQFHEFRVHNALTLPAEISVKAGDETTVHVLEPGEILHFDEYPVSNIDITARYIGTAEDERSSNVMSFQNDEMADFRTVILEQDRTGVDFVRVGTRRLPFIAQRLLAARIPNDLRPRYVLGD